MVSTHEGKSPRSLILPESFSIVNKTSSDDRLMKRRKREQVIQKFPHRCPYCDQTVSYEKMNLKSGENEIECPKCKRKYIKVVIDSALES